MELICGINIHFKLNFQGNEKIQFFSQVAKEFQILRNEAFIIAGYDAIVISTFH